MGAGVTACLAVALAAAYPDAPPPAHTGGFGEPTCRACHFDLPLNQPLGSLTVRGPVEGYEAGRRYVLTVEVSHPEMEAAGFQISARFAAGPRAGRQAGVLAGLDSTVSVVAAGDPAVAYAGQSRAGTAPHWDGAARWPVEWRAPTDDLAPVVFHIAANAANHDASEFGDYIYVDSVIVSPGSERR